MNAHQNGGMPRAWRLILAKIHDDQNAEELIRAEISHCPGCWAETASMAIEIATGVLIRKFDLDGATVIAESEIAIALEANDRDQKRLPITREWIDKCTDRHWWGTG